MLTRFQINDVTNNMRTELKGDINYLLEFLNNAEVFGSSSVDRTGKHVAKLRNKIEDPPSQEDIETIKNRLNDLINSLQEAGIIE